MPIIESAKKRARQNVKKRVRNHSFLSEMRSLFKNILKFADKGELEKIAKFFSDAQSSIDKCVKKNLISKNNAARKKSRIARAVSSLVKKGQEVKIVKKVRAKTVKSAPSQ